MARIGSTNHQVGIILKQHNGIRESKLESRNESGLFAENGHKVSDKFHSYKSLDNVRNNLKNLGNYAKSEFGVKDMSKINQEIVSSWIRDKNITYNTASNYLSELNKIHEHLNISKDEVKSLRTELKTELTRTTNLATDTRAYKNLDKIQLNDKSQVAFELQRDHGLRMSASTHINIDKQLNGTTLSYREKGGKVSEKELSNSLANRIRENSVNGKYELSNNTYRDQLKKEIENSGQVYNGTHGIRHTYAHNQLEAGATKQEVSEMMGHTRAEITNVYLR